MQMTDDPQDALELWDGRHAVDTDRWHAVRGLHRAGGAVRPEDHRGWEMTSPEELERHRIRHKRRQPPPPAKEGRPA